MNYKLLYQSSYILRLDDNATIPNDPTNIDYQEYLAWVALGNTPEAANEPTAEQIAKDDEVRQASITARQYFAGKQAAIDFIRLTPAQQETQIDAMTLAQLKTVVKYLTIAVSALVKREFL